MSFGPLIVAITVLVIVVLVLLYPGSALGRFTANFTLILFFGVLGSGWVLYYTDWFEVIGGLLALGGAFTWLAFVFKLLPEGRVTEMQKWTDSSVFQKRRTAIVVSILMVGGVLFAGLGVGSIQLESLRDVSEREFYVYLQGHERGESQRLRLDSRIRTVLRTCWWSPANYVVKVSGYPDAVVRLYPLQRQELRAPASFQRRVILLRPVIEQAELLENSSATLVVKLNGKELARVKDYRGDAFWVGCDEDVEVPRTLQDTWQTELARSQRSSIVLRWLHPRTLGNPDLKLGGRDRIEAEVLREGIPTPIAVADFSKPLQKGEFVIEGILREPVGP